MNKRILLILAFGLSFSPAILAGTNDVTGEAGPGYKGPGVLCESAGRNQLKSYDTKKVSDSKPGTVGSIQDKD
jgi:hypothetical protein